MKTKIWILLLLAQEARDFYAACGRKGLARIEQAKANKYAQRIGKHLPNTSERPTLIPKG